MPEPAEAQPDDDASFAQHAAEIRRRVGLQGFTKLVGAELEELLPGRCVLAVAHRDELLQQHGFFHGGVTAFLIDNATTIAAATTLPAGDKRVLTAEYKLNFLSPATGDRLVCRARVVKPGKLLTVVSADVFSVADGQEKQTATALATIAVVDAAGLSPRGGTG